MNHVPAESELLAIWERGDGERAGTRALLLLAVAASDAPSDGLVLVPAGRRDATLLALREQLFGSRFTGVSSCPACGEEIELTFDAAEVRRDAPQREAAKVAVDDFEVEIRLPNAGDLAAIDAFSTIESARSELFSRCVVRANRGGAAVTAAELPPDVVDSAIARLAELDPQADVTIDVRCPGCAHVWREPFDVVSFLWSELATWARRLLTEVHLLASAHGWSEREILGMTPLRRATYLEMLA